MGNKVTSADSKHNRWKTSCLLCRLSGKASGKLPQFMTQWRVLEARVSKTMTCDIHVETRQKLLKILEELRDKQDQVTSLMLSLTAKTHSIVSEDKPSSPIHY